MYAAMCLVAYLVGLDCAPASAVGHGVCFGMRCAAQEGLYIVYSAAGRNIATGYDVYAVLVGRM